MRSAPSAVELRAGGRTIALDRLAWHDAHWTWRPHAGAWVGLAIDGASIQRVALGAAAAASSTTAVEPDTLRLPFALTLDDLRIAELQLDGAAVLRDITTRVELGHDGGREHRLPSLAFISEPATVSGSIRMAADAPFALDAQTDSELAGERGTTLAGQRPSQRPAGGHRRQRAVDELASGRRAARRAGHGGPICGLAAVAAEADHARARPRRAAARCAADTDFGRAEIDTQGLDTPVAASARLTNAQPGRWDEQRLPVAELDLDLMGRADQRDRLVLRRFEMRAPGDAGRISGQGEWRAARRRSISR